MAVRAMLSLADSFNPFYGQKQGCHHMGKGIR